MTDVSEIEHHLNEISLRLATLGDIDSHIVELTDQVALLASAAQAIVDRS
jgi:hypothetical protein